LKKYILFFVALFAAITVKAQSGYNYYEFGIGADASYERGYTNITKQYNHIGFNGNLIYNYNPYLPIEAEVQVGQLSGGGLGPNGAVVPSLDPFGREYVNNYKAVLVHADLQLGATIDYTGSWILNIVKNFYAGTGFGLVFNNNKVQRIPTYDPTYNNGKGFPGQDVSTDFSIPLRFGYEFKIWDSYDQPSMAIDLGYVHNLVLGEGLDGYDDPESKFKNNATNQYRQITIGFKYFFGTTVAYNKLIREFRTN